MKNINVYLSQRLATTSDRFHLGCLINKKDMTTVDKQFVWLEFTEIKNKEYPEQNETWDNPEFLFNQLYTYLENKLTFKVTKEELELFEDIHEYLDAEKCSDLLELLNTAINLNWK